MVYEPYGRQMASTVTIGRDRPGYTGHVRDVATGLNYMQQRYYDPGIGRFLSVDPVTANSGTGANFNRYWYANNNPYKYLDPDGRCTGTRIKSVCNGGGAIGMEGSARSAGPVGNVSAGAGAIDSGKPRLESQAWPAGSERQINVKDKPGEGDGKFGSCRGDGCARRHQGIDANGTTQTKIYAFRDGVVIRADNADAKGYGNQVVIDHGDGLTTKYSHLSSYSVEVGQNVPQGQDIGTMGRSGNTPRFGDTHLHFEVRGAKGAQDPLNYFPFAR